MDRPPVYLAGPDVFLPDAREIGAAKLAVCARHGLEGKFPLDAVAAADVADLTPTDQARAFFDGCVAMMDECVAGIANLTPFRGVSADVGTVFELGYLFGRGLPVFGYTSELAPYHERVGSDDGTFVEPFGLADNLMVEGAALHHGHEVIRAEDDAHPLAAMTAFEMCVARAATQLH